MNKKQRPTQQQDEIRLRGLRILARMIVRGHLASLGGDTGGDNADDCRPGIYSAATPDQDLPWTDDEYVG